MYQEGTRHFGEPYSKQAELKEMAQIIAYKDSPYIEMQVKGWTMEFKVPEHVAEVLDSF
ncbi:MAG TPA: hypothetical protein VK136_07375 [Bacillota bacterium]|nr:hypothetical protein [Bacillota bacterium]